MGPGFDPWTDFGLVGEACAGWAPLEQCDRLLIVVGVTGVGKTTCLGHLAEKVPMRLLPNRRSVADRVIIPLMQRELGLASQPVSDRLERFRLTAGYRDRFPGGVAHALSRLRFDPSRCEGLIAFDGLRGISELSWAVEHFPRARFLALYAPGVVRLQRLLARGGDFDRTAPRPESMPGVDGLMVDLPGLDRLMSAEELSRLCALPAVAELPPGTVAGKAAILLEEAKNYDPDTTLEVLRKTLGHERFLSLDTSKLSAEEVAEGVKDWIS